MVSPCRPDSCILPAGGFMNEQENVALVRKLYDAFARGDIETILNHVTDDTEWSNSRSGHGSVFRRQDAGCSPNVDAAEGQLTLMVLIRRVVLEWRGGKLYAFTALLYIGTVLGVIAGTGWASKNDPAARRIYVAMLLLLLPA